MIALLKHCTIHYLIIHTLNVTVFLFIIHIFSAIPVDLGFEAQKLHRSKRATNKGKNIHYKCEE